MALKNIVSKKGLENLTFAKTRYLLKAIETESVCVKAQRHKFIA